MIRPAARLLALISFALLLVSLLTLTGCESLVNRLFYDSPDITSVTFNESNRWVDVTIEYTAPTFEYAAIAAWYHKPGDPDGLNYNITFSDNECTTLPISFYAAEYDGPSGTLTSLPANAIVYFQIYVRTSAPNSEGGTILDVFDTTQIWRYQNGVAEVYEVIH